MCRTSVNTSSHAQRNQTYLYIPSTVRPCFSTSPTQNSTTSGTCCSHTNTQYYQNIQDLLNNTHLFVRGYRTGLEGLSEGCEGWNILLMFLECFLEVLGEAVARLDRGAMNGLRVPLFPMYLINLLDTINPIFPAGGILSLHTHTHTHTHGSL